jgi:predicted 3-demethylubiquinone-9 3-methyltransferase (glyoxalase superfamily)
MKSIQKITPFLWFDHQAEEAARFYTSVFRNSRPAFKFTEAVSFVVNCDEQQEVDEMWDKLSAGGQEIQCGWLKDKYGLCWQILAPPPAPARPRARYRRPTPRVPHRCARRTNP